MLKYDNQSPHLRPIYSDATQLHIELSCVGGSLYTLCRHNSTRRRVELCRYKRAFREFKHSVFLCLSSSHKWTSDVVLEARPSPQGQILWPWCWDLWPWPRKRCMVLHQTTLNSVFRLPVSTTDHNLDPYTKVILFVPRVRLARCGKRAFVYAAPYIWNSLPTDLKDYNLSLAVFERRLKSYFLTRPML